MSMTACQTRAGKPHFTQSCGAITWVILWIMCGVSGAAQACLLVRGAAEWEPAQARSQADGGAHGSPSPAASFLEGVRYRWWCEELDCGGVKRLIVRAPGPW